MEAIITAAANGAQTAAVENQTSVAVIPEKTETGARQAAWRLFGTSLEADMTAAEAMEKANLNYQVESEEICRVPKEVADAIRNGQPMIGWHPTVDSLISSHKATYRSDHGTTLGVVGKSYGIVQNDVAFSFLDYIAKVSDIKPKLETAGSLGNGESVFVTARLGEDFDLGGGDMVNPYLVISNRHDGKGSVSVFFTPIRVICQNSLNVALRNSVNRVNFTHTTRVNDRIAREQEDISLAKRVLGENMEFNKAFLEEMTALREQRVNGEYVRDFIAHMVLTPAQNKLYRMAGYKLDDVEEIATVTKNRFRALTEVLNTGIGQQQHRGTKLWLLNGVTTLHNEKVWKSGEDEFNSVMSGTMLNNAQKAYNYLTRKAA